MNFDVSVFASWSNANVDSPRNSGYFCSYERHAKSLLSSSESPDLHIPLHKLSKGDRIEEWERKKRDDSDRLQPINKCTNLCFGFICMFSLAIGLGILVFMSRTILHDVVVLKTDTPIDRSCHARLHTDAPGTMATSAALGSENHAANANECCSMCKLNLSCTVWVFNDQNHECWLKAQLDNKRLERPVVYPGDAASPWTAGTLYEEPSTYTVHTHHSTTETFVHTVVSTNGGPKDSYTNW